MTYTPRLQMFESSARKLRRELIHAEDDLLALRDREKRMADLGDESDAELADKYGMRDR
jgi:hypothetical protein